MSGKEVCLSWGNKLSLTRNWEEVSILTNYCLDRCNYLLKNTDNPLEYLAIRTVFGVKTEICGTNVPGTQHDS